MNVNCSVNQLHKYLKCAIAAKKICLKNSIVVQPEISKLLIRNTEQYPEPLHSAISVTTNIKTFLCSCSCYGKGDKTLNHSFHFYLYSSCVIKVYNHNFCTIIVISNKGFT
jgi:hypothetical protein